jgi:chondroitin AC lyase
MSDPGRLAADLVALRGRLCHDPVTRQACDLAETWRAAAGHLGSQAANGLWPDIDYGCQHLRDWAAVTHLTRLLAMARAWESHESPMSRDPGLLAAVLRGLAGWYARAPVNPNWWWNQIGAPMALADVLLLVRPSCPPDLVSAAVPAFTAHHPVLRFTGQNLVWTAGIEVRHGVLTDDAGLVGQGLSLIAREVRVNPGAEGIQPDMSFFQHGLVLYSGGYGQGFAADASRFAWLAAGTSFAWPPAVVDLLVRYVLDGCMWMVRGRTFEYGAVGREITRPGHSAARFRQGLRYLAVMEHARQAECRAAADRDPGDGASLVTGNRHFWRADLMVQHWAGAYISVRMPSRRIENADWPCCGGEGRLCHHLADGATFILRDGDEVRDLFPAWNWRQIPGTTVEQDPTPLPPDRLRGFGEPAFAGGASDGEVGCAGVSFSRAGLSARKAWFFFADAMVALGSAITTQAASPVRTTINQCRRRGPVWRQGVPTPLADGTHELLPGSAFWHDGVGYAIFQGTGVLHLATQAGAWNDCGVGSVAREEHAVVNAGIEHGCRPAGAAYAYAVLPAGSPDAAFTTDVARTAVVVRNDADVQAVWHTPTRRGHVVFHSAATAVFPDGQAITVDAPCVLLYRPGKDRTTLTVADPAQSRSRLGIALAGVRTVRCRVDLPQAEYAGSSLAIALA